MMKPELFFHEAIDNSFLLLQFAPTLQLFMKSIKDPGKNRLTIQVEGVPLA